jgi:putative transposase
MRRLVPMTGGRSLPSCAPRGPAALAVGGIGAGDQRGIVVLSVPSRSVCGVSERRFCRTPGGVCSLGLHLVWCPKYRCRILGGRVAARCDELLDQVAGERGWEIVATEVMSDQVHLFVLVGATDAPAAVVRAFRGRTARVLRQEFPYLRRFVSALRAKAKEAGRTRIEVDPRHTSDGCENCGHAAPENRVTKADFLCQRCSHRAQADEMAARNILRAGLALHAQAA